MLQSFCQADFIEFQNSLEDYQKKINACKQKIGEAKSEVADSNLDFLQRELEEELQREHLLREELRDEIKDLEYQRKSVEDRKQILKKLEKDELRAQRKLSMYASVTNIIPGLDDQTKIYGHIVERDKKMVAKFDFEPVKESTLEISINSLWKMINL